jgi:hypothetical protein
LPERFYTRLNPTPVVAPRLLTRADPARAIHALEPAIPYELGSPRCAVVGFYGSHYPILFRGEAYLATHKGPEAAREYQRLLDHPGIMIGDPVAVLARYGLARSYTLASDANNARIQYKKFPAPWRALIPTSPSCGKPEQSSRNFIEMSLRVCVLGRLFIETGRRSNQTTSERPKRGSQRFPR